MVVLVRDRHTKGGITYIAVTAVGGFHVQDTFVGDVWILKWPCQ
jgi:hypothetical protein